jgi:hypothetical protein
MANLPDIFVARKILSSEYQPYACGKIFRAPRSRPNLPISVWTTQPLFCSSDFFIRETDRGKKCCRRKLLPVVGAAGNPNGNGQRLKKL